MKKGFYVIVFVLILISSFVYALTDDFNNNVLDSDDWDWNNGTEMYLNNSNGRVVIYGNCTNNAVPAWLQSTYEADENSSVTISLDYQFINRSGNTNKRFYFMIGAVPYGEHLGSEPNSECGFGFLITGSTLKTVKDYTGETIDSFGVADLSRHEIVLTASRSTTTDYALRFDGDVVSTFSQGGVCADSVLNFTFSAYGLSGCGPTYDEIYIDDFSLIITGGGDIESPCDSSDDCNFGKCEGGKCVYATFGDECDFNEDCLSGVCSGGECSQADLWSRVDNQKNILWGDDSDSNNLVALGLMVLFSFLVITGVASKGGGMVGGVLGAMVFVALGFFFTIVGWLSAFILFGIVLVIIALIFVIVMIGGVRD